MKVKLYQVLSARQFSNFLKERNSTIEKEPVVEIKTKELFGDFIIKDGYKFKITHGSYQCLETPLQKHKAQKINIIKCKTDSLNYK